MSFRFFSVVIYIAILCNISLSYPFSRTSKLQNGDYCDWRRHPDECDTSQGLSCSYSTNTCTCWDLRKIYSSTNSKCVGKAGEECSLFDASKACIENSYCVEDHTISSVPVCVCLKGYYRSENGSCIPYAKYGQSCDTAQERRACDSGLKCIGYKCQCDSNHEFDQQRQLCMAKAGHTCSKTLNNCVDNADCTDRIWELDHSSGETKVAGYRCACRPGLKITVEGGCAADYGANCRSSSECVNGQNLSCLDGICQCHPLSQTYDRQAGRCFNLVGTRCGNGSSAKPKSRTNSKLSSSYVDDKSSSSSSSGNFKNSSSGSNDQEPETRSDAGPGGDHWTYADCIPNSDCVAEAEGQFCRCKSGSNETPMKTCLLSYNESCSGSGLTTEMRSLAMSGHHDLAKSISSTKSSKFSSSENLKCNIFRGFACHSDHGRCFCADPMLEYDAETNSCRSTEGGSCGNLRMEMFNLKEEYQDMILIDCVANATCHRDDEGLRSSANADRNGDSRSPGICVSSSRAWKERGSAAKFSLDDVNVITDAD